MNPDSPHQTQEDCDNSGIAETSALDGHEDMIVGDGSAAIQITLQASFRSGMKRDKPALPELCLMNQKAIRSYVFKAKIQGFRDSQTGDGEQREQSANALSTPAPVAPRADRVQRS